MTIKLPFRIFKLVKYPKSTIIGGNHNFIKVTIIVLAIDQLDALRIVLNKANMWLNVITLLLAL